MAARSDAEVEIGLRQGQVAEEDRRKPVVVVLPGVHQALVDATLPQRPHHRGRLHEIRPRADDVCYGLSHVPMSFPPLPEAAFRGPPEYAGNDAPAALMAFPQDRIGKAVGRAWRDPGRMAREAWSRKVETAFLLAALVPSPLRVLIGAPPAYLAGRLAARSSRPDTSPQVAYVALWATGRREAAEALAGRVR